MQVVWIAEEVWPEAFWLIPQHMRSWMDITLLDTEPLATNGARAGTEI